MNSKIATIPAFASVEYLMTLANYGELSRRAAQKSLDSYFDYIEAEIERRFPETTKGG